MKKNTNLFAQFVKGGTAARAMLDAYDRRMLEEGYTITKTTWLDSHGNHLGRTEYKKRNEVDQRIARLEAEIAKGVPAGIGAGNEYMGQLKCQLIELRKESTNA